MNHIPNFDDFVNEGKTIGSLSDADDELYVEAKELMTKETEKFLKGLEMKLKPILRKASKDGEWVITSNLQRFATEGGLIDLHKTRFLS